MTIHLACTERGARSPLSLHRMRSLARRVVDVSGKNLRELDLSVAFINTTRSRSVNAGYRGKDTATDVLSFSLDPRGGTRPRFIHGEILLCTPVIRIKAKAAHRSLTRQTELLFLHAMLHLLGYDHERRADERAMHSLEEQAAGERFTF